MKKLKEECSAKMETLLKLQREVSPSENYELVLECRAVENRVEELKTYELNFTFLIEMGFTHFENCFYLCGGWDLDEKYFS